MGKIEQVIRLFTGYDYGLRREGIIIPSQIVGRIAGVETEYDTRGLLCKLEEEGYLLFKPSQPSKIAPTFSGWMLTDKGWAVYTSMR